MEFLQNLKNKKLLIAALSAIALFIAIVIIIMSISKPHMVPMYAALSSEDENAIIARLQALSIPYKIKSDTNQIEVAADKVLAIRMSLAQEGLPSSGQVAGYELFDKSESFGTSQFVYNINMVRALEGELSRTISSLSPISSARVHLVLPKKELFSKSASNPSASIVLKMKGSQQLNKSEIAAVAHIVATAVPDLNINNVTIVDDKGNPLKLSSDDGDFMSGGLIDNATEYKINLENRLTKIIEELVAKSVGFGKVKANVNANIDFDREIVNYETFDPEGQVIRSQRTSSDTDKDTSKNKDVSVANNIPNSNTSLQQNQFFGKEHAHSDNIVNYEISKKVGNKISEQGRIKNLSIAVLVDGIYTKDSTGTMIYGERPEDEMTKLRALITSAVGLDIERGDKLELINLKFSNETDETVADDGFVEWIKSDIRNLAQTAIIGIILIIIVAMTTRMIRAKTISTTENIDGDMLQNLDNFMASSANGNINNQQNDDQGQISQSDTAGDSTQNNKIFEVISQEGVRYTNVAKYLNETVDNHLDEAVSVIKNWLYK